MVRDVAAHLAEIRARLDAERSPSCPAVRQSYGKRYFMHVCPHCATDAYQHLDAECEAYCEECGAVSEWRIVDKRVLGFVL